MSSLEIPSTGLSQIERMLERGERNSHQTSVSGGEHGGGCSSGPARADRNMNQNCQSSSKDHRCRHGGVASSPDNELGLFERHVAQFDSGIRTELGGKCAFFTTTKVQYHQKTLRQHHNTRCKTRKPRTSTQDPNQSDQLFVTY